MNGLRKRKKLKVFNFLRLSKPFIQFSTFYVNVSRSYIVSNFIYARKASEIHACTHVKLTQQWKSTLTLMREVIMCHNILVCF